MVSQKPISFKTSNFRTFWRFFLIQWHSTANLLQRFWKEVFFLITHLICFQQKINFWTLLEILHIQSPSTANLLPSAFFQKNHILFPKNKYIFFNKTIFWTFWEALCFQSHFTANLLLLAILKKFKIFSGKPIYFFSVKRKPIFERFEKYILFIRILVLVCYLLHFFKFLVFFRKSHLFFVKKRREFPTVLRNPTYSIAFHRNFPTFSGFENTLDIFWKNAAFCQNPSS